MTRPPVHMSTAHRSTCGQVDMDMWTMPQVAKPRGRWAGEPERRPKTHVHRSRTARAHARLPIPAFWPAPLAKAGSGRWPRTSRTPATGGIAPIAGRSKASTPWPRRSSMPAMTAMLSRRPWRPSSRPPNLTRPGITRWRRNCAPACARQTSMTTRCHRRHSLCVGGPRRRAR
jgi:hypothetical protein